MTIVAACAALAGSATQGFGQQWPSRPVKVVVPDGAGGVPTQWRASPLTG